MAKHNKKKIKVKSLPLVVVGVGASAGGFRPLKELFRSAKKNTSVAFLVAQHLDEAGRTLALESLRGLTSLKVEEIRSGISIKGGHVYAIPPHSHLSFVNGKVHLTAAKTVVKRLTVIDHMLTAIGKKFGKLSVGVILSGNATDGARGIRDINNFGGLALVQKPSSAENSSMPEAAIATGAVDHVLPASEIYAEIENYVDYVIPQYDRVKRNNLKEEITAALTSICETLHQKTKHDFKHYKTSTLLRRIQRRMQVLQLWKVQDYLDYLVDQNDEVETLFRELLINVTSFFRDPEAFENLKKDVLRPLVEGSISNQKIRVWVAGCSTGEEPYSLAILFRELLEEMQNPPEVQIIATDIDDEALNHARRGVYSATLAEHVSSERLSKYFVKRAGKYHVRKDLREMCLFSIHNLINDPPFSQLDLISCRNVLIYLGSHLQKKLFPVFHYALRPNGYLFLGTSETLASHRELFKSLNSKHRIAQRKMTAIRMPSINTSVQSYLSHFSENEKVSDADLGLICQRIALDEMPLRYAAVNDEGHIISSSGGINKYVQIPEGTFQNNIVKLVHANLRAPLRAAFNRAKKEKRKIVNPACTIKIDGETERTSIIVQPMPQLGDMSELYWIAFHNLGALGSKDQGQGREGLEVDADVIDQLEHELSVLRHELDKSVQDLEASNEELKSSNEELLSMNEELQSANEELESSKEEVQNSNEALQRSNSDLENLLSSTQIATLFLDDEYRIRSFTPAIRDIYNIRSTDIGRMLSDFTSRVREMPDYPEAQDVKNNILDEKEFDHTDGRIFLRRILPYRTHENARDGIVVTFIDITELRMSEGRFMRLANSVPTITWMADYVGGVEFFNNRWYEFTGQSTSEATGHGWQTAIHPEDYERIIAAWKNSVKTGLDFNEEYRLRRHDGVFRWHQAHAVAFKNSKNQIDNWFGTCLDIQEQRHAVEAVKSSEQHFRSLVDNSPAIMWIVDKEARCTYLSQQWYEITGGTPERDLGYGWIESIHPGDKDAASKSFFSSFEMRSRISLRYRLKHKDGSYRWTVDTGTPLISDSGEFLGYIGTVVDVHDQVENERMLSDLTLRFERSAQATDLGVWYCDLPFDELIWSKEVKRHFFMKPDQRVHITDFYGHIHPEDREPTRIAIENSIANHRPYDIVYRTMDPLSPSTIRHVRAIGWTDYDEHSRPIRFDGITLDVTEQVKVRKSLEVAKLAVDTERKNLRNLFRQTPEMVCLLEGPEHKFVFVNDAHILALGFDATGMTVREAQPESVEVHGLLDGVYQTGKTAELHEIPVTLGAKLRYFNLTYAASRDVNGEINGVSILGSEVTNQVENRNALQKVARLIEKMPAPFFAVDRNWQVIYWNPAAADLIGMPTEDVVDKDLWTIFPGLDSSEFGAAYRRVMESKNTEAFDAFYPDFNKWYRAWAFPYEEGIAVAFLDITNQKVIEARLERSEERYKLLFNDSPLPKWIIDIETLRFIDVNKAATRHYGYSKEEFLSMTAKDLRRPEDIPVLLEVMTRDFRPEDRRALHRKKDGSFIEVEVTALDLVIDGRTVRMGAVVDVTEQLRLLKNAQAAREEAEHLLGALEQKSAQLETILEQMPMSVIFAEAPSGKLIFSNRQFEKVWKFPFVPDEEAEQYREYVGLHKDGRHYAPEDWPLARALRGEIIFSEDTVVLRGDDTKVTFSLTAAPVRNPQGEIIAAVVLSQDVTAQRQVEEELRQAKQAAEAANESKTRFLANMSHEIRTPLSAIMGFSDLLRNRVSQDQEANTYIERISRNSTQLGRLIDELLDLSKIEADKLEIEKTETDLDSLVEDVQSAMVLRAEVKGLDLSFKWSSPKPQKLITDPVRLSQILVNVVGNAVKFTEQGFVDVDFSTSESELIVRVTDSGIGLREDQKVRIFEPFMQADASVTRKYGGTGLGLALSKKLTHLLGGDLQLERSHPEQGSVFVIRISLILGETDKSKASTRQPGSDLSANALAHRKILVVDDSPDNRAIVGMYLRSIGAIVFEAPNGEEALSAVRHENFDLVLMDIQMPIMDGYQAMQRLREMEYPKPVIALTAHAFKEERDRCLSVGFASYITKPINPAMLLQNVYDHIQGSHSEDQLPTVD